MKNEVAIYARANNPETVKAQVRRCRLYARSRYGSAPTRVFVDAPVSGLTRPQERRGFAGLLSACRNQEVKAVIVDHPDRLSRDPGEIICLATTFENAGVVVQICYPERTLFPLNAMIPLLRKTKTRPGRVGRRSSP